MRRIIYFFIIFLLAPVLLLKEPPANSRSLTKKELINDTSLLIIDSIKTQNIQIIDSLSENLSFNMKNRTIILYKKLINENKKYQ